MEDSNSSPSLKRSLYEIEGFCDSEGSPSDRQELSSQYKAVKRSKNVAEGEIMGVEFEDRLGTLIDLNNPAQTAMTDNPLTEAGPAGDRLPSLEGMKIMSFTKLYEIVLVLVVVMLL